MESAEANRVSGDEALEHVRNWKDKGGTLQLSIYRQSDKRIIVCENLYVKILGAADASLSFRWQLYEADRDATTKAFATADGTFVVWLEGASFALLYSPKKTLTISRGSYLCVLTEFHESAFSQ